MSSAERLTIARPRVTPSPPGWLFFLPLWIFAAIAPTRLGPVVAAASWPKTMLAWALTFAASVLVAGDVEIVARPERFQYETSDVLLREDPRYQAHPSAFPVRRWITLRLNAACALGGPIAPTALAVAGPLPMALLVLPALAAAEKRRRLFARAFKLAIWAAISAPLGLLLLRVAVRTDVFIHSDLAEVVAASVCLVLVWWLGTTTRLGRHSAGAPADLLLKPLSCSGCGYSLIGLALGGACPECGRTMDESASRLRTAIEWESARGVRRAAVFAKTFWRIMARRDYFQHAALPANGCEAGLFAGASACLVGVYVGIRLGVYFAGSTLDEPDIALLTLLLCMAMARLWTHLALGVIGYLGFFDPPLSYLRRSIAIQYSAPFWIPLMLVGLECGLVGTRINFLSASTGMVRTFYGGSALALAACLVFGGICTVRAVRGMATAMPAGVAWDAERGEWRDERGVLSRV